MGYRSGQTGRAVNALALPSQVRILPPPLNTLGAQIDAIRAELDIPAEWPADVLAEAREAAARPLPDLPDRRDVELLTIDPPGSRDLDQALHLERRDGGFRVHYAIADVATFVVPGGAVDREARERGETVYLPGGKAPLHPEVLSEGAASLLEGQDRPAFLWTLDLDPDGNLAATHVGRALVRSRRRLDYAAAQAEVDGGGQGSLGVLAEVGPLRQAIEAARGGVVLDMPDQEVVERPDGTLGLEYREQLAVEGWNAQLSLLTGMAAARLMLDASVGVLRTMPDPPGDAVERLRHTARGLRLDWPGGMGYPEFIRGLDQSVPAQAAMLRESTVLLRGAAYTAFDGRLPEQVEQSALASPYAHTTAPLRRLVDRFALEICAAVCAGGRPPAWVLEALPELPALMQASSRRAGSADRAVIDLVEASLLAPLVGQEFEGAVVDVDHEHPERGTVQLADPPVIGAVTGPGLGLGERIRVRLAGADVARRSVVFEAVSLGSADLPS